MEHGVDARALVVSRQFDLIAVNTTLVRHKISFFVVVCLFLRLLSVSLRRGEGSGCELA